MQTLILVNGELYQPDVLRRRVRVRQFDLVLATDAGVRHAATLGVTPDAVVGDLDSLAATGPAGKTGAELVTFPAEKDETDLELTLLHAVARGADTIVLVGALGGRLDMTLSNILLLAHPALEGRRVEVWHGAQTAWLLRPPGESVSGRPGDTLSLMPLAGAAAGVTTQGLKYPLRGETLSPGPARGISNRFEGETAGVELASGVLLAVHTPGETDGGRRYDG